VLTDVAYRTVGRNLVYSGGLACSRTNYYGGLMNRRIFFTSAALSVTGLAVAIPALPASAAAGTAQTCSIMTGNGTNYVTAVGGGGRNVDAAHTDAIMVGGDEQLVRIYLGNGKYAFGTSDHKHYLTAVGGGGRNVDVIHTDGTIIGSDEKFEFVDLGQGWSAIRTSDGVHLLTAVGGGGRAGNDPIHSDATDIGPDERFRIRCR
jgi:hypothetical protein